MNITLQEFKKRINQKQIKLSVVGLGYVGLNISCLFVKNGFTVHGFDIDKSKVEKLQNKINPIPEESWLNPHISKIIVSSDVTQASMEGDIIFLALPTPNINNKTNLNFIKSGINIVKKNLKNKILVFESTVPPGTSQKLVKELIELETGLKAGEDFGFAHSPERIDPSSKRNFIWNTPKVVGGFDSFSTEVVSYLYSKVLEQVVPVSNPVTAEFVKVIENTQRNVNIALVNLYAMVADKLNIDISEALDAASTKWNFIKMFPGCGVGGECIDDSARMLTETMIDVGIFPSLVKESSRINFEMPYFTAERANKLVKELEKPLEEIRIGVFGLAYKGNSSDIRNSPGLKIIEILEKSGFRNISAYDPLVSNDIEFNFNRKKNLEEIINYVDLAIIATDHEEFKNINVSDLKGSGLKIILDGRNCLKKEIVESSGVVYCGIGR